MSIEDEGDCHDCSIQYSLTFNQMFLITEFFGIDPPHIIFLVDIFLGMHMRSDLSLHMSFLISSR